MHVPRVEQFPKKDWSIGTNPRLMAMKGGTKVLGFKPVPLKWCLASASLGLGKFRATFHGVALAMGCLGLNGPNSTDLL